MMQLMLLVTVLSTCIACSVGGSQKAYAEKTIKDYQHPLVHQSHKPHRNTLSLVTEGKKSSSSSANAGGAKILRVGKRMALETKEIVRGSCWDYINTVYNRAGYPQSQRRYVLKGKKNKGPYAKTRQLVPGDWLYFINHSYKKVGHSGIFVRWVNQSKRRAIILSYGGEGRKKPGRYREYDLSHVYTIIRPK